MKYVICAKFTKRIRWKKCSSQMWVDGTKSIKQESLERHVNGEPQQFVESVALKKNANPIASWNGYF